MNVTANWRERRRDLGAEYWRCESCGALGAVRRRACARCKAGMRGAARSRLPDRLRAVAWSHGHMVVEGLDQVRHQRRAMLLELGKGQWIAFPLCETDRAHAEALIGSEIRLVLRRTDKLLGASDPVAYGRKVAAEPATRIRLLQKSQPPKKDDVS